MKRMWLAVLMAAVFTASVPADVMAKRLGSGRPAGMQRQMPAQQPDAAPGKSFGATPGQQAPVQNAGAAAAGAGTAAAAGKRSWLGPIAGLAAGLGLAALMSHLGLGEAFANILMMVLLAGVAVLAIGFLMRRFGKGKSAAAGGASPAFAGAAAGASTGAAGGARVAWPSPATEPNVMARQNATSGTPSGFMSAADSFARPGTATAARPASVPAGFDVEGFERIARMIFIRMQAANDSADLNDLRTFTTPELFASIRMDLQDRNGLPQQTDVEHVQAAILNFDQEAERLVVSVRYHGMIREVVGQPAEAFDEIWHLVQPNGASQWLIAGIQPTTPVH
ncbi:putative lipid-binding transport protein (Tim44 family) [Sphaerotilus hippei]|uniref:Putative lipid-binding transport protein (Tim44 family) n=1 Tax=Sphaerotilus hippei TaxID=744406 RepID=A0A318H310_9BURK|nr:Tim44-like domain-containing protein [Sphaerotilus hippei]PXW97945.1 putative lipid-binding transport protein (Tim44 family) [Sphaerotilus hippei]